MKNRKALRKVLGVPTNFGSDRRRRQPISCKKSSKYVMNDLSILMKIMQILKMFNFSDIGLFIMYYKKAI